MGVGTLVVCSVLTCAEVFFILHSLDKHWLKAVLGYKIYLDVIFGLGTTLYFALSGTISGVIMAAISGAVFSFSLVFMQKLIGYRKLQNEDGKRVWVDYKPTITIASVKKSVLGLKDKTTNLIEQVKAA